MHDPHGYGACNNAGREFLAFLSSNEAMACSTWFTEIYVVLGNLNAHSESRESTDDIWGNVRGICGETARR